jgi:hypothetical protein
MRLHLLALITLPLVACAAPHQRIAGNQDDASDHPAILATVDRFFQTMAVRDPKAFAATTTGDGMVHSVVLRDGKATVRARSMRDMAEGLANGTSRLLETYWQPTILQRGPMAIVWTPYRFRIDAADSHWGVDAFTLVKDAGQWRIASALYTVEPNAGAELAPGPDVVVRPTSLR